MGGDDRPSRAGHGLLLNFGFVLELIAGAIELTPFPVLCHLASRDEAGAALVRTVLETYALSETQYGESDGGESFDVISPLR